MEKDNKITIITIILAFICIGILGYIIYFKANNTNENVEEKTIVEEKNEEKEETKEDLTDYDELAKNLYKIIGNNPEFRYEEKTTYETLSENVHDSIVLNKLSEKCQESISYLKEEFLNVYKEIFNQEKTSDDGLCKLNDANYECERYCLEFDYRVYSKFEKYEKEEDKIIIYEKAAHLDYFDDGKIYLKENADDELSIASFNSLEELNNSELNYKLPTYKHTFIKGENGYYWVSSELVKQ